MSKKQSFFANKLLKISNFLDLWLRPRLKLFSLVQSITVPNITLLAKTARFYSIIATFTPTSMEVSCKHKKLLKTKIMTNRRRKMSEPR